jgi:hypothetical protein
MSENKGGPMKKRSARVIRVANAIRCASDTSWTAFLSREELSQVSFLVPNAKEKTLEQTRHYLSRPDIQHRHSKEEIMPIWQLLAKAEKAQQQEHETATPPPSRWEAFHQDIERQPDDSALQDVYADWREENEQDDSFRQYLKALRQYKKQFPGGEMAVPLLSLTETNEPWKQLRQQYHQRHDQLRPLPAPLEWHYTAPEQAAGQETQNMQRYRLRRIALREIGAQRQENPTPLEEQLFAPQMAAGATNSPLNPDAHHYETRVAQEAVSELQAAPQKDYYQPTWTQDQLHAAVLKIRQKFQQRLSETGDWRPPGPPGIRSREEILEQIQELRLRHQQQQQQTQNPPQ